MTLEERFWAKVNKDGPTLSTALGPCWIWTACKREGYGAFSVGGKNDNRLVGAHIISYRLANGEIPAGLWILHRCDNRPCVRPDHLEAGTQRKNLRDCVTRGRHSAPVGERNGMAKLTSAVVFQIRSEFDGKNGSMTRLAKQYGVSVPTIHTVIRRTHWKQEA